MELCCKTKCTATGGTVLVATKAPLDHNYQPPSPSNIAPKPSLTMINQAVVSDMKKHPNNKPEEGNQNQKGSTVFYYNIDSWAKDTTL